MTRITIIPVSATNSMGRLRGAYFGQGSDSAARYHVTFDRALRHLWKARRANRFLRVRRVMNVDDLVHAIACVDDLQMAWVELAERYERGLVRQCRGNFDEIEATLAVRRMFAELRHRSVESMAFAAPTLRTYWGDRPLRTWLADRLSVILSQEGITRARRTALQSPQNCTLTGTVNRPMSLQAVGNEWRFKANSTPPRFFHLPGTAAGQ
jgi:hypothetical protein